jgi:hypothetical protein
LPGGSRGLGDVYKRQFHRREPVAIGALIAPVDFVVVFVPRLQDPCPRLALRLWADHLLGFLCLSRACLRLDWNPLTFCTPA